MLGSGKGGTNRCFKEAFTILLIYDKHGMASSTSLAQCCQTCYFHPFKAARAVAHFKGLCSKPTLASASTLSASGARSCWLDHHWGTAAWLSWTTSALPPSTMWGGPGTWLLAHSAVVELYSWQQNREREKEHFTPSQFNRKTKDTCVKENSNKSHLNVSQ